MVLIFGYDAKPPGRCAASRCGSRPSRRSGPRSTCSSTTYNEALSIVQTDHLRRGRGLTQGQVARPDARRWPSRRLPRFLPQIGVNYIRRDSNFHAKAGNLNEALKVTDGEYITLFDADHVPTRSFLQVSLGWFLRTPKLAMRKHTSSFTRPV